MRRQILRRRAESAAAAIVAVFAIAAMPAVAPAASPEEKGYQIAARSDRSDRQAVQSDGLS